MSNSRTNLLAAVVALGAAAGFFFSGVQRAHAVESFTLGEHDHLIAEAPGCHVECRAFGAFRRTCTVNNYDCRAVCSDLPECNVGNRGPMKVCAIIKTR